MKRFCGLLVIIASSSVMFGQTPTEAEIRRAGEIWVQRRMIDPSLTSDLLPTSTTAATLRADSKDKTVSLFYGRDIGKGRFGWHVKLSTPLDENADRTEVVSLRGLSGQPTFKFGLAVTNRPKAVENHVRAALATAHSASLRKDGAPARVDSFIEAVLIDEFSIRSPNSTSLPLPEKRVASALEDRPSSSTVWFGDLSVTLGRRNYEFARTDDLVKDDATRNSTAVTLAGGFFPLSASFLVGTSITKRSRYKSAKQVQLCEPLNQLLKCDAIALGAPSRIDETYADVEFRKHFRNGVGINPSVTANFKTDAVSVSVPVYFIRTTPDKKGDSLLNGGIAAGWDSETHDLTIGVFIGQISDIQRPWD